MENQEIPLPPPQPNDGSLNTVKPAEQSKPASQLMSGKRFLFMAFAGLAAVVMLTYAITSSPQRSSARDNKTFQGFGAAVGKPASPTAAFSSPEESEIDALDPGDVELELRELENDLSAL